MARFWKEKLDPGRHINYMVDCSIGGHPVQAPQENLVERWVYFVSVCSFTFQFHSLEQIQECLDFFSQKVHPSSIRPGVDLEHYWQRWYERLPQWLFEEAKRQRVVKALRKALVEFGA